MRSDCVAGYVSLLAPGIRASSLRNLVPSHTLKIPDRFVFIGRAAGKESTVRKASPAGTETAKDGRIRRKVMIPDFVSLQKDSQVGYLSGSVAESLYGELERGRTFTLLGRDAANAARLEVAGKDDPDAGRVVSNMPTEKQAILMGQKAGADVVVIGGFAELSDKVYIQVKAIDVLSRRVAASDSITTPINSELLDAVETLSRRMNERMAAALPPLEPGVIDQLKEARITPLVNSIALAVGVDGFAPLHNSSGQVSDTRGLPFDALGGPVSLRMAYHRTDLLSAGWTGGFTLALAVAQGQADIVSGSAGTVFTGRPLDYLSVAGHATAERNWRPDFLEASRSRLYLYPFAGIGARYSRLSNPDFGDVTATIYPSLLLGVRSRYLITQGLSLVPAVQMETLALSNSEYLLSPGGWMAPAVGW